MVYSSLEYLTTIFLNSQYPLLTQNTPCNVSTLFIAYVSFSPGTETVVPSSKSFLSI